MPSGGYTYFLQEVGEAGLDWSADDVRLQLVDDDTYTVNLATDQFLSDVPAPARIGAATALANKTNVGGVYDADDVTVPTVTGRVSGYVIYIHTGTPATSLLIMHEDCAGNVPISPVAKDVVIHFDNGDRKIFRFRSAS